LCRFISVYPFYFSEVLFFVLILWVYLAPKPVLLALRNSVKDGSLSKDLLWVVFRKGAAGFWPAAPLMCCLEQMCLF